MKNNQNNKLFKKQTNKPNNLPLLVCKRTLKNKK